MFSSSSFILVSLPFTPLTHFELIFESGVRKGSNFPLLYLVIQFPQHCIGIINIS